MWPPVAAYSLGSLPAYVALSQTSHLRLYTDMTTKHAESQCLLHDSDACLSAMGVKARQKMYCTRRFKESPRQ